MPKSPDFDVEAAHQYFAAHCYNRTWDLMEKKDRSPEDDRLMVALNQASLYHWSERSDNSDLNRSIGYWQASRVQALLENAEEARRYAEVCLMYSEDLEPFYRGYAYEALARAAKIDGDQEKFREYLRLAKAQAGAVESEDERGMLEADLNGLDEG